jgi:hypothetical protein
LWYYSDGTVVAEPKSPTPGEIPHTSGIAAARARVIDFEREYPLSKLARSSAGVQSRNLPVDELLGG